MHYLPRGDDSLALARGADTMEMHFFSLFCPVFAFIVNVVVQVSVFRLNQAKLRIFVTMVIGFLAGLIALFAFEWWLPGGFSRFGELLANTLIYVCLSYSYFHFNNMGETARRIRMVRDLSERPDGMTVEEIVGTYNSLEMVRRRIGRLASAGYLVSKDNRIINGNPTFLRIAQTIRLIKWIVYGTTKSDLQRFEQDSKRLFG